MKKALIIIAALVIVAVIYVNRPTEEPYIHYKECWGRVTLCAPDQYGGAKIRVVYPDSVGYGDCKGQHQGTKYIGIPSAYVRVYDSTGVEIDSEEVCNYVLTENGECVCDGFFPSEAMISLYVTDTTIEFCTVYKEDWMHWKAIRLYPDSINTDSLSTSLTDTIPQSPSR